MFTYYNYLFTSKLKESRSITNQYAEAIEDESTRLSLKISALAYNSKFIELVTEYNNSQENTIDFIKTKEIDNILDIFFDYSDDLISLVVFLDNREPFLYKNPFGSKLEDLKNDLWFKKISEKSERIIYSDDLTYQKVSGTPTYRYTAALNPPSKFDDGIEGILILYKSSSIEYLSRIGNDKSIYAIYDKNKNIIFSSGNLLTKEYLKYELSINRMGWTLVHYTDIKEIKSSIFYSILLLLILITCITIMFIIYLKYQINKIFGPIEESIQRMSLVEKGDFSVRLNPSEIPELNRMAKSFNNMVVAIEDLTFGIKKTEAEKKSIEIKALQFQINPHFLSNTLNTIKIMARLIDSESIRETTTCLMRIVSNSFREPGELNNLSLEIRNIEDYIHIMKVRFGDSFWVEIRRAGELEDIKIMKMLIQPIVENAIIHGLVPIERQGYLLLNFHSTSNKLIIDIIDNGIGIESRFSIANKTQTHKGLYNIGISNIEDRIKLNYGDNYGIEFKSRKNRYTKVTLTLPLEKE